MVNKDNDFKGIIPPIITPFDEQGLIDYEAMEFNIKKWNETDLTGYLIFGSNGESVHLSDTEKINLTKEIKFISHNKKIIVASGKNSTKLTIELTNKLGEHGADAALLLPPFYYGLSNEDISQYFIDVADNTEIPIMIYNVPKYTNMSIPVDTIIEISYHENIIGIKDSSGDVGRIGMYVRDASDDFNVFVGTANAIYASLILGAEGGILALANIVPDQCTKIYDLVKNNKLEQAKNLQLKLIPVNLAITAKFGVSGLKYAMDKLGYKGGKTRKPLSPISDKTKKQLDEILKEANLIKKIKRDNINEK